MTDNLQTLCEVTEYFRTETQVVYMCRAEIFDTGSFSTFGTLVVLVMDMIDEIAESACLICRSVSHGAVYLKCCCRSYVHLRASPADENLLRSFE